MRKVLVLTLLAALATPLAGARASLPQDDAGSGGDAPNVRTAAVPIDAGVVYSGLIEGKTFGGDYEDWYSFSAPAGVSLQGRVASPVGCLTLHDATGAQVSTATCAAAYVELGRADAVSTVAGTYYARFYYNQPTTNDTPPQPYRFAVGVAGEAPAPTPVPAGLSNFFVRPVEPPPLAPAAQDDEHVVVAVVDTGINPYHDFFAAPALADHPSTWLPGFPASAESVSLSLDEPDLAAARAADAATWAGLQRSAYAADDTYDAHLYTFPGTRVVGAVSFGEFGGTPVTPSAGIPVADDDGHGTHSAGLAAGSTLAAPDGNVLIVAVEVGQGTFDDGIRWAARQPWIDAVTVSLGGRANLPLTFSPAGDRLGPEWATREAHLAGKPVFVASGNGFSNTGVTPDHCSTYTSGYTGPAWITRIGAAKADNGSPTWWHCVPVEATAKTDVPSPAYDSVDALTLAGGTSASTPNAAGHWAHLMLAAREAGSTATRAEALDHLLHAAAPPPLTPGTNDPSVYPLSLADQGYGLIDEAALDAARTRLLASSGPAPRPETEDWFANDARIRTALWGPGSATAQEGPAQDDAGSGGDAPNARSARVRVQPGVRYEGLNTGLLADEADWYAFDATAGDVVTVQAAGAISCYDLVGPSGTVLAGSCTAGYAYAGEPVTATLTETGTHYISLGYFVPQQYSFGFGLNGSPPPVFP